MSEKQGPTENTDALFTVDPQYGFLKFRDRAAFDQTLDYLYRHQASLDSFEASIPGFVSQRAAYNSIDTDEERLEIVNNPQGHPYRNFLVLQEGYDGEMEAVRVVGPVTLACLVSESGLIVIESKIYKYFVSEILLTENLTAVSISEIQMWQGGQLPTDFTRIEIKKPKIEQSGLEALDGQCSQSYAIGNKDFRVKGTLDETTLTEEYKDGLGVTHYTKTVTYSARTEHSARKFGVWWDDKGDLTLRVNPGGVINWNASNTTTITLDESITNQSRIERVLGSFICVDCNITSVPLSRSYTVVHIAGQDGQSATCNNVK